MGVEQMSCCGALTRVYGQSGPRKHNPGCPSQLVYGEPVVPTPNYDKMMATRELPPLYLDFETPTDVWKRMLDHFCPPPKWWQVVRRLRVWWNR